MSISADKSSLTRGISTLRDAISSEGVHPSEGLGRELFHFVSTLVPIVNVDLLVYNAQGQFLLSWRDDPHAGTGWHIPGGCIRFRESIDRRIKIVAREELGLTDFVYEENPIGVFEIIAPHTRNLANPDERGHFITLTYRCMAPMDYKINNGNKNDDQQGYLKWFDHLPNDFLEIQSCYKQILL